MLFCDQMCEPERNLYPQYMIYTPSTYNGTMVLTADYINTAVFCNEKVSAWAANLQQAANLQLAAARGGWIG